MITITLGGNEGSATTGTSMGSVHAAYNLPPVWQSATGDLTLGLKSSGEYIGYPDQIPPLQLDFRGLSSVSFDKMTVRDGKVFAEGQLAPSIGLIGVPIVVTLNGPDVSFSLTYSAGELRLPVPGVTIDEALMFTVYQNRWQLASFQYGSDLTFGVRFPIHYREGQPFDISLDDVEFQVPDVSPRQILGDLVDRIA